MKLRYYLRGLGIGIVVTAFIMSRVSKTEELTDAQIKVRALELGMVEETVLADLPQAAAEKDETKEDGNSYFDYTAGEAEILEQEKSETEKLQEDSGEEVEEDKNEEEIINSTEKMTEIATNEEAKKEEVQLNINNQEEKTEKYIIIAIEPGNGSETVSRRLYNAGLVESAIEYNRFLVENGYDRILVVGNHEIPEGASEEDMAKILCGMQ